MICSTDIGFPNPAMVMIPSGEFKMGASAEDKFANHTELPSVKIRVREFAIGSFAVTVGEYRAFQPDHAPGEDKHLPVVHVSWNEASQFCEWLSDKSGKRYRLPSEAEWEFACRAGTTTPFHTGHHLSLVDANYFYNEAGHRVGQGSRVPVGSYPPNHWGLHEVHGNVSEWCADSWHPSHECTSLNGLPRLSTEPTTRVIRGGSWDYLPRLLRSSWRDGVPAGNRRDNLGFRIACTLVPKP